MSLKAKLTDDLKEAMRAKDSVRLDTVRSIRAAVLQREVDGGTELDDSAVVAVIRSLRKQRVEAIAQYKEGNREDLVERETKELALLDGYLPQAPDAAAIAETVQAIVTELNACSMRDMGRVMQEARRRLSDADGKELSEAVKRALTQS